MQITTCLQASKKDVSQLIGFEIDEESSVQKKKKDEEIAREREQ